MLNKKQRKIIIYTLMLIYTYIFITTNVSGVEKQFMEVDVPSAVVIDAETGRVLYEKNAYEERAMASLTKIMTSILLIENCKEEEIITAPKEVSWIGGSLMGLKAGDTVTSKDLLAGMMLPSGNDAAFTAAMHIGGNIESFASMMTNKAKEIGAYNTSFKNPHGLDAEGHYSTAYDLALIMRYALKYPIFCETINKTSKSVNISGSEKVLTNTNALLRTYEYADGGKTGYTANAERCLICTASKNGIRLICVVLGATTTDIRFSTARNLLEETFNRYKKIDLSSHLNFTLRLPIIRGEDDYYDININETLTYIMTEEEIDKIYIKEDIIDNLYGGDIEGKYLGRLQLMLDDEVIFSKDYMLNNDIMKKSVKKYYKEIILKFC